MLNPINLGDFEVPRNYDLDNYTYRNIPLSEPNGPLSDDEHRRVRRNLITHSSDLGDKLEEFGKVTTLPAIILPINVLRSGYKVEDGIKINMISYCRPETGAAGLDLLVSKKPKYQHDLIIKEIDKRISKL